MDIYAYYATHKICNGFFFGFLIKNKEFFINQFQMLHKFNKITQDQTKEHRNNPNKNLTFTSFELFRYICCMFKMLI